jgi:hypothetical protein
MSNKCWYCWSYNTNIESCGKYNFKWIEYDYEVIFCDEEDNGCLHSWSVISNIPEEWLHEIIHELNTEYNQNK